MNTVKQYLFLNSLLPTTIIWIACFFAFGWIAAHGQSSQPEQEKARLQIGTRFNSNLAGVERALPFWLHANQHGLYDQGSANGLFWAGFVQPVFSGDNLEISTSGQLAGRTAENPWLGIQRLSATVDYRFLKLQGGRFIDPMGMNYHPLSSGSMLYSTNARPVPKITLKTDGFLDVPGAQGYVQFSSYISHGWLEKSRYVENVWLHQKNLYLKINYKMLEGIGGIVHNVQWAGMHPDYGQLPHSFSDYLRMVIAQGAREDSNAPGGEQSNALGNSVAGYDFNLRINLDDYRLTFYRLFYLEDKVSTRFRSPWDGMWGGGYISNAEHPLLKALLYEHINTKRQDSFDFEPRGSASYYNNGVYRSGWTYLNRVLGNPLLLTDGSDSRPVYNNIIVAHHLGVSGFVNPQMEWKAYYTFSRNYGDRDDQIIPGTREPGGAPIRAELRPLEELKKVNHSLYMESSLTLPKYQQVQLSLGLALDLGELYTDRIGIMAGISYRVY